MDKLTQLKFIKRNLFLEDIYIFLELRKCRNPLNITSFLDNHPILNFNENQLKNKLNHLFENNMIANVSSDKYFIVFPFTNTTIDNSRFKKVQKTLNRLQLKKLFTLSHCCFTRINQFKFKKRKLIVKRLLDKFFNKNNNTNNNINNNINIYHNDNHNDSHNDNHNESLSDNIKIHNDNHNESLSDNIKIHNDNHNDQYENLNQINQLEYRETNLASLNFIRYIKARFKNDFPNRNNYVNLKPSPDFDYDLLIEKINASSFLKSRDYLGLSWFIYNYKTVLSDFYDDKYYSQNHTPYKEYTPQNNNFLNSIFKNIK